LPGHNNLGTVLYELLVGNSPYYNDDIPTMYQNIQKGKLDFPSDLSDVTKDLITVKIKRGIY